MVRAADWPPGPPPPGWHYCAPSWEEEEKRELEEWAAKERLAERNRRRAAARVLQYRRETADPSKKTKGVNDGARRRRRQKQKCRQEPPVEHPGPEKQSPPRPAAVPQRRLPPPPSASRPEAAPPAHSAVAPDADALPVTVSVRIRDLLFAERRGTVGIIPVGNTEATTAGGVSTAVIVDRALNSATGLGLEHSGGHSGQPDVFEALGKPLLTAALEGRVASFVAYGPSDSIFGQPGDPGVVPRLFAAFFASGKVSRLTVEALCVYQGAVCCLIRLPWEAIAEQVPSAGLIGDDPGDVDAFPSAPREHTGSHTVRDTSPASEGAAVPVKPTEETPAIVVGTEAEPLPSDPGTEGGIPSDEVAHAPPPVKISIRVRDALFREGTSVAVVVDGDRVGVDGPGRIDNRSMVAVDGVLYQRDQAEVYEAVGRPLAAAALNGQDGLAIACGPSGSGKTHTIFGGSGNSCGLLPRLLEDLFSSGTIRELEIEVLCTFQEKVYDLLREAKARIARRRRRITCLADWARRPGSARELLGARREAMKRAARAHREAAAARGAEITMRTAALKLRRDPARGADVAVGSRRVRASTAAEAVAAILAAADRRPTAATPVNPHSSRAHLLVNLAVQRWDGRKGCRVQIVDMAGGERLQSHVHDARRREGLSINKSLLALKCSVAARRKGWDYVPVRGSVLTRMLVYEGTHVEWVSTVAPGSCYAAQTRVTIQEAEAVRGLQRTRVEAAALAALKAAQERALAERRERQSIAAGAAAAAGLVAAAAGLLELQEAAERRAAAERVAPAVGAAGAMICTAAYHALWAQTVQRVKKAQAAGGERWTQQYRAALPKACRKVLNPANIRSPCCWRCWPRCRRRTASTRRHRAGHPGATRRRRAGSG